MDVICIYFVIVRSYCGGQPRKRYNCGAGRRQISRLL